MEIQMKQKRKVFATNNSKHTSKKKETKDSKDWITEPREKKDDIVVVG